MKLTPGLPNPRAQQAGVSLVELMISMTLGLLILSGALQLYVGMVRNSDDMANTNAQIEAGRFVLQVLENDLGQSGFWNGYVPQFDDLTYADIPADFPAFIPEPCRDFSTWHLNAAYKTALLGVSVQAYDAVPSGCENLLLDKKDNTDILLVRHADVCIPGVGDCEGDTGTKVYFQSQFCGSEPESQYEYVLDTQGFNLQTRSCAAGVFAEKRRYSTNIYYVRNDNTLMRAEFGGNGGTAWNTAPLIEGVEGFSVELGLDSLSDTGSPVNYGEAVNWVDADSRISPTNRGDGTPDGSFIHCSSADPCSLNSLVNVVAAKIYVLARNTSASNGYSDTKEYVMGSATLGPYNDKFKRHVYSTTVRLSNISARRQTP